MLFSRQACFSWVLWRTVQNKGRIQVCRLAQMFSVHKGWRKTTHLPFLWATSCSWWCIYSTVPCTFQVIFVVHLSVSWDHSLPLKQKKGTLISSCRNYVILPIHQLFKIFKKNAVYMVDRKCKLSSVLWSSIFKHCEFFLCDKVTSQPSSAFLWDSKFFSLPLANHLFSPPSSQGLDS